MPPVLFLSYSRKNLDEITTIAQIISVHGIRTWQDISNLGFGLAEHRIRQAIQSETSGLLFYSTHESVSSSFIKSVELPEAERRHKQDASFNIVPVFRLPIADTDASLLGSLTVPISNFNGAKVEIPADQSAIRSAARRAAEIVLQGLDLGKCPHIVPLGLTSKQAPSSHILLDLNFSAYFSNGYPSVYDWNDEFPAAVSRVKAVLTQGSARTLRLYSYAHLSLGLLFGFVFRDRTGFTLEIEQTNKDRVKCIWSTAAQPSDHDIDFKEFPGVLDSQHLCVKINLVARDDFSVGSYLKSSGLACRAILEATPPSYPYIISNEQAIKIARQLSEKIKELHGKYNTKVIHLFATVPLGLAVLIGYNLNACGSIQCYEYDNSVREYRASCFLH